MNDSLPMEKGLKCSPSYHLSIGAEEASSENTTLFCTFFVKSKNTQVSDNHSKYMDEMFGTEFICLFINDRSSNVHSREFTRPELTHHAMKFHPSMSQFGLCGLVTWYPWFQCLSCFNGNVDVISAMACWIYIKQAMYQQVWRQLRVLRKKL